ncbi:hypothetical protein HDU96_001059, partial [Phlyctochytrium bullatum]
MTLPDEIGRVGERGEADRRCRNGLRHPFGGYQVGDASGDTKGAAGRTPGMRVRHEDESFKAGDTKNAAGHKAAAGGGRRTTQEDLLSAPTTPTIEMKDKTPAAASAASKRNTASLTPAPSSQRTKGKNSRGPDKKYIQALKNSIQSLERRASQLGVLHAASSVPSIAGKSPAEASPWPSPPNIGVLLDPIFTQPSSSSIPRPNRDEFLNQPVLNKNRDKLTSQIMSHMNQPSLLESSPSSRMELTEVTSSSLSVLGLPQDIVHLLIVTFFRTTGAA